MPDISMCRNEECPLKEKCYRYTAEPSPFRQAYAEFKVNEEGGCDYYWDNTEYESSKSKRDEAI